MVRKSAGDGWTPSQLTRAGKKAVGRRPRRPHLYEKRKGGPAPRNEGASGVSQLGISPPTLSAKYEQGWEARTHIPDHPYHF
jgi:hypothetical protein